MTDGQHRHGFTLGAWSLGEPPHDSTPYRDVALAVEGNGLDFLMCGDHLFPYAPNQDALSLLSYWAGLTTRVSLGTGVLLLPLRDPVITAKALATIDLLSDGRLIVGVGVGGEMQQEWDAMEIDPATRGRRCDEHIDLMRQLWSGAPVSYDGTFRKVAGVVGSPVPVQPGGPPIIVGGRSEASLRRAVRHQGWFGYFMSPRTVKRCVDTLRELAGGELPAGFRVSMSQYCVLGDDRASARQECIESLAGRYRQDVSEIVDATGVFGTPADVAERAQEYVDAGVDDICWAPQVDRHRMLDQIERIAEARRLMGGRP